MLSIPVSTFAPRALGKYRPLIPLLVVWALLFYTHIFRIPRMYASKCSWNSHDLTVPADEPGIKQWKMMVVADPQLIDNHTYPGRNSFALSLSKHTVDTYLYRNFKALTEALQPDSIVFLGDLLDNGRSAPDDYYNTQVRRFARIFDKDRLPKDTEMVYAVPGNHDIGWADGVKLTSLQRFNDNFGVSNQLVTRNGHDIVMLDTISLSNNKLEEIYKPPRQFMDEVAKMDKKNPRILMTHVPLFRDKDTSCGSMREANQFPISKGYQYQTVLDKDLSNEILSKIKPDLILSGDDHDYCELYHSYKDPQSKLTAAAKEITVKSISMAMGIHRPAVELITLFNRPVLKTEHLAPLADDAQGPREADETTRKVKVLYNQYVCYLPVPYHEAIFYGMFAGVNVLVLFFWSVLKLRRSIKQQQPLQEDVPAPRISSKLSHYLHSVEEEEKRIEEPPQPPQPPKRSVSWLGDDLVRSFVTDTSKHQLYKRLNLKLLFDQCFVLALAVLAMYSVAIWIS